MHSYVICDMPLIFIHIHIGELPVTIDFMPYDRNPGDHNITIVANSTMGEMANHTMKFHVPSMHSMMHMYPF